MALLILLTYTRTANLLCSANMCSRSGITQDYGLWNLIKYTCQVKYYTALKFTSLQFCLIY